MENQKTGVKKVVSRQEFEKKVDIEAAHLEYMDRMKTHEARNKAYYEVGKSFEVGSSNQ